MDYILKSSTVLTDGHFKYLQLSRQSYPKIYGKDLPEGFQRSEFVLEHGFLDGIYERKNLKKQVNLYIDLIQNIPVRNQ